MGVLRNLFLKPAPLVPTIFQMLLQDWLVHPDVNLAAYYPVLRKAGIEQLQVRFHAVQAML